MKLFFLGAVCAMLAVFIGAYVWLSLGGMPMKMSSGALPGERFVARLALRKAIGDFESLPSPITSTPEVLIEGSKLYGPHCAVCHGLADKEKTEIAKGLFPPPPNLLPPSKGVTDDPVGETFWKIKYGIRMTAMPAFEKALSDNEIWKLSLFLLNADKVDPKDLHDISKSAHN